MAESVADLRSVPKLEAYDELHRHLNALLEGVTDRIAGMATLAALVHNAFSHLWTGFYIVATPGMSLRVGPYQGGIGCIDIRFGQGVCGTAAQNLNTVLVPDVAAFPGHITCDDRARSEIVVPVFDKGGDLIAVLDVDSAELNTFDDRDRAGLEKLVTWFRKT